MKLLNEDTWVEIVTDPIQQPDIESWLIDPRSGAICTFSGTTREWTKGMQTQKLFFECYPEMAFSEMQKLISKTRSKWVTSKIALLHRIGDVAIGESSVFIGVSTPHRNDAFDACRYLIDTLKEDVPIWKKDFRPDGSSEWVGKDQKKA